MDEPRNSAAAKAAQRPQNPRRCDMRTLARLGQQLAGEAVMAELPRLAESVEAAPQAPAVAWQARGEERTPLGGEPQAWLHLQASAEVQLVCQRCLQPMPVPLQVQRSFLFVRDEATAEQLDEEMEDDVLVLPRQLDLLELLEDELILALPLVPRHEACPQPLPMVAGTAEPASEGPEPHPFAALAALKKSGRPN